MSNSNTDDIKGEGTLEIVVLDALEVIVEPYSLVGDVSPQIVELPNAGVLYLRAFGGFSFME